MVEPSYKSTREFADTYGIDRDDLNRAIAAGAVKPRRNHGNSVLTETDMIKYVRWNTERNKEKNHD